MVFGTLNASENALALEARRVQVRGKSSGRMHSLAHLSSGHPELPSTSYLAATRVSNPQPGNLGCPTLVLKSSSATHRSYTFADIYYGRCRTATF